MLIGPKGLRKIVLNSLLCVGLATLSLRAPAADAPRRIEVVAKRFTYVPAEITLKKGEPVVIALRSEDVAHGLKFKELNLQTDIGKGATSELSFTPQQAGEFVGHCSHFCGSGHGSMTLKLHVTE
jgi:cytochrome c oxidase subunit 2